ncbi:MAG TPA: phosphoribosyltransferase [Firmicutes bacterium]|nr:phosphoribosyltransferase [Candidatus Fermentithermobacillaceae bacterium]
MDIRYLVDPLYRLTWEEVMASCKAICEEANATFGPNAVVGIATGGLIPATIIASILQVDLYPCLVTRRRRGRIVHRRPETVVSVSEEVKGRRVIVVDEMVVTGETMRMVSGQCKRTGARLVKTACIWVSSESWKPTLYSMESHGYVQFPWNVEVLSPEGFILNPVYQEYIDSLELIDDWIK